MKAPVLGLSLAAAAFAGSSLYLWKQLDLERERSAQVADTTRRLNARIAELEQTRQRFAHVQASNGTTVTGAFGVAPAAATPVQGAAQDAAGPRPEGGWTLTPPRERPPAMDKMMRWQIRADHKRMYADVGAALGIGKEKAGQLIDLLTEQQLAQFGAYAEAAWNSDPTEVGRKVEEQQRNNLAAIEELLGPDKTQALKEYQQSLPARQEFEMLVNQLEGNDVTLTPEQHRKLLDVYLAERKRVPMPQFDPANMRDPTIYQTAYSDWQNDYSQRITAEARHILDDTQLGAFNEVQEWQREMRSQFQAVTFSAAPPDGVMVPANGVSFAVAGGAVAIAAPASPAEAAAVPRGQRQP
jgi:hypothetical protein